MIELEQVDDWELPCKQCGKITNGIGRMAFSDVCRKCYDSNWESQFTEGIKISVMGKNFRTAICKQCGGRFKRGGIRSHIHYKHGFSASKVRTES